MFRPRFGGILFMTRIAALFAGGRSRRMGSDKAGLTVGGETLLERTARIAEEAGLSVLVVGRARPDDWSRDTAEFVPDDVPGLGPLGALTTALRRAEQSLLVLACDLPLLDAEALRWLLTQTPGPHGLAVVRGGTAEPLFSLYAPACLPLASARLGEGRRSLRGLIEAGSFARVDAPNWIAARLVNVNTPEEWAEIAETR